MTKLSTRMTIPAEHLLTPPRPGHTSVLAPSFSFLIEHAPSNSRLLFDLGLRKDLENLPPAVTNFLRDAGWGTEVKRNVAEILQQQGEEGGSCGIDLSKVSPADIGAIILSHHHFDHVGDLSTFPAATTEIVVGPGFRAQYLPGWPTNDASTLRESEWLGRNVREVSFEQSGLEIGGFEALDYFGDGSFYLLNSPGHTVGHLAALARVTLAATAAVAPKDDDTFILMGGDTCHFVGQMRPTSYCPIPEKIVPSPLPDIYSVSCAGAEFQRLLNKGLEGSEEAMTTPFYDIPATSSIDMPASRKSLHNLEIFDAADNVLVIIAHDESMLGEIDFFPETVNSWKAKGVGQRTRWKFLKSFQQEIGV